MVRVVSVWICTHVSTCGGSAHGLIPLSASVPVRLLAIGTEGDVIRLEACLRSQIIHTSGTKN
jgi:hypothetical protein